MGCAGVLYYSTLLNIGFLADINISEAMYVSAVYVTTKGILVTRFYLPYMPNKIERSSFKSGCVIRLANGGPCNEMHCQL